MNYTKEELERLIIEENRSYSSIGKMYNLSGNAIKKAAIKLGIELQKRRKVSVEENFSHPRKGKNSLVYSLSDDDFKEIVCRPTTWVEIANKLGYKTKTLSVNVRETILERCTMLGMVLTLKKNDLTKITKGEIFCKYKNWQSARSLIRRYAQQSYIDSGNEMKCAVCGYDKHVEIAHIKAVSEFSDDTTIKEINSIDNLIALCPNHHWEYDNGVLKL